MIPHASLSLRSLVLPLSLAVLLPACPGGDDTSTTEAASSTGGTTTDAPTTTGQPTTTSTIEPVTTDSGSTAMASSSSGADTTTTGAPSIPCEDAVDEASCNAAGALDFDCGWLPTRHFVLENMMCVEVAQGGLCMTTSWNDSTCGIMRDASCMNSDAIVYVRPSTVEKDAIETLSLTEFDACEGPDPGEGWELCEPVMGVPGCRCGCS